MTDISESRWGLLPAQPSYMFGPNDEVVDLDIDGKYPALRASFEIAKRLKNIDQSITSSVTGDLTESESKALEQETCIAFCRGLSGMSIVPGGDVDLVYLGTNTQRDRSLITTTTDVLNDDVMGSDYHYVRVVETDGKYKPTKKIVNLGVVDMILGASPFFGNNKILKDVSDDITDLATLRKISINYFLAINTAKVSPDKNLSTPGLRHLPGGLRTLAALGRLVSDGDHEATPFASRIENTVSRLMRSAYISEGTAQEILQAAELFTVLRFREMTKAIKEPKSILGIKLTDALNDTQTQKLIEGALEQIPDKDLEQKVENMRKMVLSVYRDLFLDLMLPSLGYSSEDVQKIRLNKWSIETADDFIKAAELEEKKERAAFVIWNTDSPELIDKLLNEYPDWLVYLGGARSRHVSKEQLSKILLFNRENWKDDYLERVALSNVKLK